MSMCVASGPGLAGLNDELTAEEWAALESGPGITPPTYTPPSQWSHNLAVPTFGGTSYPTSTGVRAFLSPGNPMVPKSDYSFLLYAGLGVLALMLVMKK